MELGLELGLELGPELGSESAADFAGASAGVFVSERREAGEGETAGGWEVSFTAGFAAAVFNESRLVEEFDFALREASGLAGCSADSGATARAAEVVEPGEEDSTRLPRNLGNAMMAPTTTTATASGTT